MLLALYTYAICGLRFSHEGVETTYDLRTDTGAIRAVSKEEAKGVAQRLAEEKYPPAQGWTAQAMVHQIPEQFVRETLGI